MEKSNPHANGYSVVVSGMMIPLVGWIDLFLEWEVVLRQPV